MRPPARPTIVRGLTSGVSVRSSRSRRCSCIRGSRSCSPRWRGILVDGEPRRERGDLEQDAPRLAEVDRGEVVAVAHVGDIGAGLPHPLLPGELLGVGRRPGDVMHRARPLAPGGLRRRVVAPVERAVVAEEVVTVSRVGKAERLGEEAILDGVVGPVGPGAVHPGDRVLGRDLRVAWSPRRALAAHGQQLVAQPVVVGELEAAGERGGGVAARDEAVGPEGERGLFADR